jgi:cytochrome b6-f complex iron-sulfur subunit
MSEATSAAELTPLMSRRDFARLAALACAAAACSSDEGGAVTAPTGNGITINGNTMTIPLAQNSALDRANGMIIVTQARVAVIRLSATDYRTLSSVCTHEGCTVNAFNGSQVICPCHGSQFSTSGAVVRGPAGAPLRSFPTTFDATRGVVTVNLA